MEAFYWLTYFKDVMSEIRACFCKCANILLVGYVAKDRKSQDSDLGKRKIKNLCCLAQCCVVYMNYLIHINVVI